MAAPRHTARFNPATDRLLLMEEDGVEVSGIEFPEVPDKERSVTLIFKPGTKHSTGLHWHEQKAQHFQITQGRALCTVGSHTAVFGPDDGVIVVPRSTLHQLGRADSHDLGADAKDVELRIREWSVPADARKEGFYRNMLGVIQNRQPGLRGNIYAALSLFAVMSEYDNYPAIVLGPSILGETVQGIVRRATTYSIMGVAAILARLCGCKGTNEEYTPQHILDDVQAQHKH